MSIKGYAAWRPQKKTQAALEQVLDVIEAGRDDWPLTQRYWLYRLMGKHGWEKFDEYNASTYKKSTGKQPPNEPKNLNNILSRGRRAGVIPWGAIASSRGMVEQPSVSDSPEVLAGWLMKIAEDEQFGRQAQQPRSIALWMETEGLFATMKPLAHYYGATMLAGKGFDVLGRKHDFAKQVSRLGDDVLVLHCGDLDRSGHTVKTSLDEDIHAFIDELGGNVEFKRILLTENQVHEYNLSYSYVEPGLNKGNHGKGFTSKIECQLEAMDIADMKTIIRREFETALDMDIFNQQLDAEKTMRLESLEIMKQQLQELPCR